MIRNIVVRFVSSIIHKPKPVSPFTQLIRAMSAMSETTTDPLPEEKVSLKIHLECYVHTILQQKN